MTAQDRDFVFSESVKAGKRIYYFDVKQSSTGENFVSITESKKVVDGGTPDAPHFTFEKHKVFLYKEDYRKFMNALKKAIAVASGRIDPAAARAGQMSRPAAYGSSSSWQSDQDARWQEAEQQWQLHGGALRYGYDADEESGESEQG